MYKLKKICRGIALIAAVSALLLGTAGCASTSQNQSGLTPSASAETAPQAQTVLADLDASWDGAASTKISLNGSSATVEGSGAAASGGVVTISAPGTYVVSGALDDGQLVIDAAKGEEVRLVLNGADITNRTGAPIYASKCGKLILTLAEGTLNTMTDGGTGFAYAKAADEEPNAAVFSKNDLTINGSGSLTVNAGFNNGIVAKDNLVVAGGNITIIAANHGLRGNDSVTVLGGSLRIMAGNDGIQTNNEKEADKGWILIEGGSLSITSAHDAIQADTTITVTGGTFELSAGGGVAKAQTLASSDTTSDSFKGLKATGNMTISAGVFIIDSFDDCLHANGNITISGGTFTLSTADDGVHADGDLTITGGILSVKASYEGLEAANITITDGVIDVVSSDDGINAAGGRDQAMGGGRFGRDNFASAGNYSVSISGGQVTIYAGGDGIDSNGTIAISGGNVVSIIRSTSDNEALDCDGTLTVTGGTVVYGGTGTGGSFSSGSTQSYVFISSGVRAGNEVTVRQNGKTLISFTPASDCQYLAFSSPEIAVGQSYEVYSGTTLLATATAGTGGAGMSGPGMGGPGGGQGRPGRGGNGF